MFQRLGLHQFLVLPFDIVWMTPIVDFLSVVAADLLLILARRLAPGTVIRRRTGRNPGVALAALPPSCWSRPVHKAVALVLAVGVGIQLSRLMSGPGAGGCRLHAA